MSRASANSVPKKCANLYIKGTFCDLKCTNSEKRHCSEQLFSSCLLFASVVYGTGTYADRKFQASGRISDIFRPNKLARNSFQCIHAHPKIQEGRWRLSATSQCTCNSAWTSSWSGWSAYSHGILDNSFFSFFVPQQHCFLCVSTRCVLFLHVVRVFWCVRYSPNKINYACNCRNLFMYLSCS